MPDRTIYADKMRKYLPISLVETGRGCKHNCEFCSIAKYYDSHYIHREVEDIIAEIKKLVQDNISSGATQIAASPADNTANDIANQEKQKQFDDVLAAMNK